MAKTARKGNLIRGLVAIISLLAVFYFLSSSGLLASTGLEGFTTISINEMTVQSDNPNLNGEVIQMITTVDGSGRSAKGIFSPTSLSRFGYETERAFTIEQTASTKCQFQIKNTSVDVYTWGTTSWAQYRTYQNGGCPNIPAGCTLSSQRDERYGCTTFATCPAKGAKVGTIYFFDSSTTYLVNVSTTLSTDDGYMYSIPLSSSNKQGQIPDVMYARLIPPSSGWTTCPVPASEVIAFRTSSTADFQLKPNYIAQNAITRCSSVPDVGSAQSCANAVSQLLSASADNFYYCDKAVISGTTTKMTCEPKDPPIFPNTEIIIKADKIGIIIPVGDPEIVEVKTTECEPTANCIATVKARNKGTKPDSFDLTIVGLTPTSTRVQLDAGEEQTVQLPYSSAGIIKMFPLTMTSVNDPSKVDTEQVKIKINPFCDENPPSANHVRVMTEYGCKWVCPNQYTIPSWSVLETETNIFEGDCAEINYNTEEDIDDYISMAIEQYGQNAEHCTGQNKYARLDNYLEALTVFAPVEKEHQIWLSAPFCKYVAEYGYKFENGLLIQIDDGYTFYERGVPEGAEEVIVPTTPSAPPEEEPEVPPITEEPSEEPAEEPQGISLEFAVGAFALGAILYGGYVFLFKYKRKR